MSYTVITKSNGRYQIYRDSGCQCSDQNIKDANMCCVGVSLLCRIITLVGLCLCLAYDTTWNGGAVNLNGYSQDVTLKLTKFEWNYEWTTYSSCTIGTDGNYVIDDANCSHFKDLGITIMCLTIAIIFFECVALILCCCRASKGLIVLPDLVVFSLAVAVLVIVNNQFIPAKLIGGETDTLTPRQSVGYDFLLIMHIFKCIFGIFSKFWCTPW